MGLNVGGVNINIGVDIANATKGINSVLEDVKNFQKEIGKVTIHGAIKGNPFSMQAGYIAEGKKRVEQFYKVWLDNAKTSAKTSKDTYHDATKAFMADVDRMEESMKSLMKTREAVDNVFKKGTSTDNLKEKFKFDKMSGTNTYGDYFKGTGEVTLTKNLEELQKTLPTKNLKVINELLNKLKSGANVTATEVSKDMERLSKSLANVGSGSNKLADEFKKLEESYKDTVYKTRINAAKSTELALERQKVTVRELTIAENRHRTEISQGINVAKNKLGILDILNKKKQLGVRLTLNETNELGKLQKEQKKLLYDSGNKTDNGFLSADWFKQRAVWFIQLRLFWGIYRKAGEAVRSLVDYEVQLHRALRTAQSSLMSHVEIVKEYSNLMGELTAKYGATWKDIGETLYQLGSAGLSAEESIAAAESTLQLLIGTEGDARETTKAVAGIYNNFGSTLTNLTTKQEKFQYITDLMAYTWKTHQVEISEYTDGMKLAANMAITAGVSFETLNAVLAVSNQHMIKGGRAGRAFTNVLARLSQSPYEFKEVFNLDDTIFDPTKPINVERIFGELHKRMKAGTLSAIELGDAFERMGLRGAPTFETLIKYWNEVTDVIQKSTDVSGENMKLQAEQLDTLEGKWKKFMGSLRRTLLDVADILDPLKQVLDAINKATDERRLTMSFKKPLTDLYSLSQEDSGGNQLKYVYGIKKSTELLEQAKKYKKLVEERESLGIPTFDDKKQLEAVIPFLEGYVNERKNLTNKIEEDNNNNLENANKYNRKATSYLELQAQLHKDDLIERKKFLEEKAKIDKQTIDKEISNFEKNLNAGTVSRQTGEGASKNIVKKLKEYNKILSDIKAIDKELISNRVEILTLEKSEIDLNTKGLEQRKKMLELKGVTKEEGKEIAQINEDIYNNDIKEAQKTYDISVSKADINTKAKEAAKNTFEQAKATALLKKETEDESNINKIISEEKRKIAIMTEIAVNAKNEELAIAKRDLKDKGVILKLERDMLDLRLRELKAVQALYIEQGRGGTVDELRIREKIREVERDTLAIEEKRKRNASIMYDYYKSMQEDMQTFHDLMVESLVRFTNGMADGLGGVFASFTMGFQKAQQEVENLKGDLKELKNERDDITNDGTRTILNEEEAERLKEINQEMANLNKEIEDLKDPLENTKNAIKDFFKTLIDEINNAIARWLAMQMIMGVLGAIGGSITNLPSVPSTSVGSTTLTTGNAFSNSGVSFLPPRGKGGLIPRISSFSRGGVTSGMTFAQLGDNQSGVELVIPEENINQDHVSGYTRNKGSETPIYIANILTEADFQGVMAKQASGKVVINHILGDIDRKGPIFRKLGGK